MGDIKYYPIKFKPIYKEMIWGGTRLATMFGRQLPSDKVGETWDISCRPGEMGIIENGPHAGLTFEDYIAQDKTGVLGIHLSTCERFPLLVKIIDANDALSIQVHPGDDYAQQQDLTDTGKNEMWYILNPPDDGYLIIGLKPGVTREKLADAYNNGTVEDCLDRLYVKTGDIVNIPSGLVHALTPGVIVAEVQQNSDVTYRLYDYNRIGLDGKPRTLHVEDALAVSDFEEKIPKSVVNVTGKISVGINSLPTEISAHNKCECKNGENKLVNAITNSYFAITKYALFNSITEESDPAVFYIFTCVEGCVTITANAIDVEVNTGQSVFIPAKTGVYTITPMKDNPAVLLRSSVPNLLG